MVLKENCLLLIKMSAQSLKILIQVILEDKSYSRSFDIPTQGKSFVSYFPGRVGNRYIGRARKSLL